MGGRTEEEEPKGEGPGVEVTTRIVGGREERRRRREGEAEADSEAEVRTGGEERGGEARAAGGGLRRRCSDRADVRGGEGEE